MLASQYEKITTRSVIGMIAAGLTIGIAAWVGRLSMKMTSNQASEEVGWLGNAPAMREYIDGRSPAELRENSFRITNKDYEASIKVKPKDLRRDKTGQLRIRIGQLVKRVLNHPAKLISTLIINGSAGLCYDGKYFFDTTHSEGDSGVQSNSITYDVTTTTAPTSDEMGEAIMEAIGQIMSFVDDRGEPINEDATEFDVMVPTRFNKAARKAVKALLGSGGGTATIPALADDFKINIITNPRLNSSWTTKFAVFRTDDAAKPFILQEEVEPTPGALDEDSEYAKVNGDCLFWTDWAGNVAYGFWQDACLVTLV